MKEKGSSTIKVDTWCFYDAHGKPFRGIGLNLCWESRDLDDSKFFRQLHEDKKFSYDQMIPKLAKLGVNIIRVWMVYWNLPIDWPRPSNNSRYSATTSGERFNSSAIEHFKNLLRLCEANGMTMILCLETHVGFLGEGWHLNPYNILNGGHAKSPADFFANPLVYHDYQKKLDCILDIVGSSPAVIAWELFNEVDNLCADPAYGYQGSSGLQDKNVAQWHKIMGEYLRHHDVLSRPVTTSVSHREVAGLWTEAKMDFNQHHIYCRTVDIPRELEDRVFLGEVPHGIGEFGHHWDWSIDFRTLEPQFSRDLALGLWLGLFSPSPFVPLTWWWEYFEQAGLFSLFTPLRVVSDRMLEAGKGKFELEPTSQIPGRILRRLRCGKEYWAMVYTTDQTMRSDQNLPHGIPAHAERIDPLQECAPWLFEPGTLLIYNWAP